MRSYILTIILIATCSFTAFSVEPDLLVTQDGEGIKVFNLDVTSSDNIYYTLSEDSNAPLQKMLKKDILIIRKADGTKIDPSSITNAASVSSDQNKLDEINSSVNKPVTFLALEPTFIDVTVKSRKYKVPDYFNFKFQLPQRTEKQILAGDGIHQVLNMRLIDENKKHLAVTLPRDKEIEKKGKSQHIEGEYDLLEYTIPDYVLIGDEKYVVTEIDSYAFFSKSGKHRLRKIYFPSTLKSIGIASFAHSNFSSIILPENLEKIGDGAFIRAGANDFKELYIPKSVKELGEYCFWRLGPNTSFHGYYQGYLSSIPNFITIGNCTSYGIDEEAVEAYEKRKR